MLVSAIPALALVLMAFGIYTLISGHSVGGGTVMVAGTIPLGIQRKEAAPVTTLSELEGVVTRHLDSMRAEVKAFGDGVDPKILELKDRVHNIEQHLVSRVDGDDKGGNAESLGRKVLDSAQFLDFVAAGRKSSGRISIGSFKTALVNATGQNQPLVAADQGAGSSPQVYENVDKAESAIAFELAQSPVGTLAHWIPVSKQILDDAPALQAFISGRMLHGLKVKEEGQLLNGTGTGTELKGLITVATIYDDGADVSGDTPIDSIRHALTQVQLSDFYPDAVILHPTDWEAIDLVKTTGTASSGEYVVGQPRVASPPMLWGVPVIVTRSMGLGKFLVGAFRQAAILFDRQQAVIEVSFEHADFFIKNMAAILCEERLALAVPQPDALRFGSFPS